MLYYNYNRKSKTCTVFKYGFKPFNLKLKPILIVHKTNGSINLELNLCRPYEIVSSYCNIR